MLDELKIQLSSIQVNLVNLDQQPVSQAKLIPFAVTFESVGLRVMLKIIFAQCVDVEQSFRGELKALDEQTEIFNTRHHGFHGHADTLAEIAQQFQLDQFSFSRFGNLLTFRTMIAQRFQGTKICGRFLATGNLVNQAVDQ